MASISSKKIAKNLILSIIAQFLSLGVSFVLSMIVPKFIDEYQYSYWQSFLLYAGYVGIFYFGILDGLVLRYSQYNYEELDKKRIRSQFQVMSFFTTFSAIFIALTSFSFFSGTTKLIMLLVSITVVTKNTFGYVSYLLQITNRIDKYVKIVIGQRLTYGLVVVILILSGVKQFYFYCLAEIVGDIVGIIVGSCYNKGLFFGKSLTFIETLRETKLNISAGIMLLFANWSSQLLMGSAKMIVQWRWDELLFGKISFAFSLSNLFLTFVSAISVVLFPSLKRMSVDELPGLYKKIRNAISPLLFFAMLLYFPGYWILQHWLPKYQESLIYLGILFPIIIYASKVSLLTNNYLKAYREEKKMLMINVFSILVAFILLSICAFVLNNLTALLICIVFVIAMRSILSELVIIKVIKINLYSDFIIESIMTVGFILSATLLPLWGGCMAYLCLLIIYTIFSLKNIKNLFRQFVVGIKTKNKKI